MRRFLRGWAFSLAALSLAALSLAALSLEALADIRLGFHSEEPAPTIATLITSTGTLETPITPVAFQSSQQVLEALNTGAIELGILEDAGQDMAGIGLVAELYPSVLHMLHPKQGQYTNVGELLASGPVWAGPPGSIGYRVASNIGADFNLPDGALELLPDPWTKEPTVLFIFGGILARDALDRLPGFSLYGLDQPGALMQGSVAEGVALRYPYLRPFVLPAQLYPGLDDEAALTLAVNNVLVARASVDNRVIYQLAMGIERLTPQIAAAYPMAGLPQLNNEIATARTLSLHPGAQRYQDRDLPDFLERNAEVLSFGATLVIATGSLLVAWQRHRRQSRKDTLDRYYQRLLDLREELSSSDAAGDVARQVRDTQSEVMALVIRERIDADGSLLAFLALSNQLLEESGG